MIHMEKLCSFKTTTGKIVDVPGGNYGWKIDKAKELEELIKNIKSSAEIKKSLYTTRSLGNRENDIGDTYVEINLTNQSLWFYKKWKVDCSRRCCNRKCK